MTKFNLIEIFEHKGRTCAIIRISLGIQSGPWYNGYVESSKRESCNKWVGTITADELTFSGPLDKNYQDKKLKGKWFYGFDSGHAWNEQMPESKTYRRVRQRTKKLCEEMIEVGL